MGYKVIYNNKVSDFAYERFFFNQNRFLDKIEAEKRHSFYLLKEKTGIVSGEVHFFQSSNKAYSPLIGSFGSFQVKEDLKAVKVADFIHQVEEKLSDEGVEKVIIRNYPICYAPSESQLLTGLLLENKYYVKHSDLNFHIDLSKDFNNGLKESEKARLKTGKMNGFRFEEWLHPDLEEVFLILKLCRDMKNYPMTLSKGKFLELFVAFPEIYKVFRVVKNQITVAVAVTVHISSNVCYNFYLGEKPEIRAKSPATLLIEGMAKEAKSKGYKILDLGIGTDKGISNFGLINFKQNMGGEASLKVLLAKELSV